MRRDAEKKMLAFVASLKYYSKMWPRAYLFSKLTSIIGRTGLPGSFKNSSLDEYDVFTQQYFLWLFKTQVSEHKENFKEYNDGTSYMLKQDAMNLVAEALYFLPAAEISRVEAKVSKEVKPISKPGVRPFDGVDSDFLFNLLVEEFVETRAKILKGLKVRYLKLYEIERGSVSTQQFANIIAEVRKEYTTTAVPESAECYDHPSGAYLHRTLLYCLTSATNAERVEVADLVTGCHRLGMDSPFPVVIRRDRMR